MALWRPYAQETALDLSKGAVKTERASPLSTVSAPQRPGMLLMPEQYYGSYTGTQQYQAVMPWYPPPTVSPDTEHNAPAPPELCIYNDFVDTESLSDDLEYQAFERDTLEAMAEKNVGTVLRNNPKMRRVVQTSQAADDSYRKQRDKNNFAAKQSRDRRKFREVRLALKVTFLKKKMAQLRTQLVTGLCSRCRCPQRPH